MMKKVNRVSRGTNGYLQAAVAPLIKTAFMKAREADKMTAGAIEDGKKTQIPFDILKLKSDK